jgi:uncharacterized membrane protein YccC
MTLGSELHAARGALEQRQAQGFFQIADRLAQGRLGHEQLLRRLAEVQGLRERKEHAKLPGRDIHSLIL